MPCTSNTRHAGKIHPRHQSGMIQLLIRTFICHLYPIQMLDATNKISLLCKACHDANKVFKLESGVCLVL